MAAARKLSKTKQTRMAYTKVHTMPKVCSIRAGRERKVLRRTATSSFSETSPNASRQYFMMSFDRVTKIFAKTLLIAKSSDLKLLVVNGRASLAHNNH
jgi:hypothetical protein